MLLSTNINCLESVLNSYWYLQRYCGQLLNHGTSEQIILQRFHYIFLIISHSLFRVIKEGFVSHAGELMLCNKRIHVTVSALLPLFCLRLSKHALALYETRPKSDSGTGRATIKFNIYGHWQRNERTALSSLFSWSHLDSHGSINWSVQTMLIDE